MSQQDKLLDEWFKKLDADKAKDKKSKPKPKGTKNKSMFPKKFIEICKKPQAELKEYLEKELAKYYDEVINGDGYLWASGTYPVVLTAHMDTVHKETVKDFYGYEDEKGHSVITSPQGIGGDDRCGVFMILEILRTTQYRPTIIFCEDEEIGGVGSDKFIEEGYEYAKDVKFFIELDRANANDLVYYSDGNEEFHDWCEKVTGYKEAYGSFSDISNLCPDAKISGVNISCGYYKAHTTDEYVVLEEMLASIDATIKLLDAAKELEKPFEYKVYEYSYGKGYSYSRDWWSDYYKDYYNDCGSSKAVSTFDTSEELMTKMVFYFYDGVVAKEEIVTAEGKLSAIGIFLTDHPSVCWADVYDYEVL